MCKLIWFLCLFVIYSCIIFPESCSFCAFFSLRFWFFLPRQRLQLHPPCFLRLCLNFELNTDPVASLRLHFPLILYLLPFLRTNRPFNPEDGWIITAFSSMRESLVSQSGVGSFFNLNSVLTNRSVQWLKFFPIMTFIAASITWRMNYFACLYPGNQTPNWYQTQFHPHSGTRLILKLFILVSWTRLFFL